MRWDWLPREEWEAIARWLGPRRAPSPRGDVLWSCRCRDLVRRHPHLAPKLTPQRLRSAFWRWNEHRRLQGAVAMVVPQDGAAASAQPGNVTPARRWRHLCDGGCRLCHWDPREPGAAVAVATYNVKGPRIRPQRFEAVLALLRRRVADGRVALWCLTEFRPTVEPRWYHSIAAQHGYVLTYSVEPPWCGGGGLALLIDARLSSGPTTPLDATTTTLCRGHALGTAAVLPLLRACSSGASDAPLVAVCAVYVPHDPAARRALEPILDAWIAAHPHAILLGDWNATTRPEDHSSGGTGHRRPPHPHAHWPWLQAHEAARTLVDAVRSTEGNEQGTTNHTRVRLYSGSTSYIDRIYLTRALADWIPTGRGEVIDFADEPGASDHNPVVFAW